MAAVGVALAIVHTNAMNLYPSTVDLLVALNTLHKPFRWEQPLATVILGILATILAIAGILDKVQGFLSVLGDVIIPFTFVVIADWIWIQKKRTPLKSFFEAPRQAQERASWTALTAFGVGFVLNFWGASFLPGFFYNILPLPVAGGLISVLLYLLFEVRTFIRPAVVSVHPEAS